MTGDRSRARVLVVDDDVDHLFMLESVLERLGYQVLTAESCAAGRAMLEGHEVDALLADLNLADGTALDLLAGLPAARRPRLALVLSGFDTAETIEQSLAAGFAAHLVKPIAIERLSEALARGLSAARSSASLRS